MYDHDPDANVTRRSTPRNGYIVDIEASPNPDRPERLYVFANGILMKTFDSVDRTELIRRANDYADGLCDMAREAARIEANSPENKRRAYERAQNEAAAIRNGNPTYDPPDWLEASEDLKSVLQGGPAPELKLGRSLQSFVPAVLDSMTPADVAEFHAWIDSQPDAREDETWDKPETSADYPDIDYEAGQ